MNELRLERVGQMANVCPLKKVVYFLFLCKRLLWQKTRCREQADDR